MDYTTMLAAIKKYLEKRYSYEIINNLRKGKHFIAERKDLRAILPQINEDILEILLEKMSEDGYISKDDGHTITFSLPFIFQ